MIELFCFSEFTFFWRIFHNKPVLKFRRGLADEVLGGALANKMTNAECAEATGQS